MRIIKQIALIGGVLLLLGLVVFVVWALNAAPPMAESLAAMASDETVTVQSEPWLVFQPTQGTPTTGLIFYPGGRVDARAYAPVAHKIAEKGYLVVVVPMPLNLAVFGASQAGDVMSAFPDVDHWVIGGHSLGGSMAANFADNNPDLIDGIVFLASYPADSDDLSDQDIESLSIYGTQDGLASPSKILALRSLLPQDTNWLAIEGGNHAQFGWYGSQSGDNDATISRIEQQEQIQQAILELLASVNKEQ
jgi:pimeloyl-ACP methyl ester carboxylesterase